MQQERNIQAPKKLSQSLTLAQMEIKVILNLLSIFLGILFQVALQDVPFFLFRKSTSRSRSFRKKCKSHEIVDLFPLLERHKRGTDTHCFAIPGLKEEEEGGNILRKRANLESGCEKRKKRKAKKEIAK